MPDDPLESARLDYEALNHLEMESPKEFSSLIELFSVPFMTMENVDKWTARRRQMAQVGTVCFKEWVKGQSKLGGGDPGHPASFLVGLTIGIRMAQSNPEMVERWWNSKEQEGEQSGG